MMMEAWSGIRWRNGRMFVGYVGVKDREKKKKSGRERLYTGYDWLSIEGRFCWLSRKYGQGMLYMGYDWLSMEGRL